jgi:hypothetical protein
VFSGILSAAPLPAIAVISASALRVALPDVVWSDVLATRRVAWWRAVWGRPCVVSLGGNPRWCSLCELMLVCGRSQRFATVDSRGLSTEC